MQINLKSDDLTSHFLAGPEKKEDFFVPPDIDLGRPGKKKMRLLLHLLLAFLATFALVLADSAAADNPLSVLPACAVCYAFFLPFFPSPSPDM